jgi:hypothetical protein
MNRYVLRYKVPTDFEFTIQKHLDSVEIFAKEPEEKEWKKAEIVKELLESWGGMWRDCGGARYRIAIKVKDRVLPVAIGEYSYQACIPGAPQVKNYAMTVLKFVTACDVMLKIDDMTYIFYVRYLNEFEV